MGEKGGDGEGVELILHGKSGSSVCAITNLSCS